MAWQAPPSRGSVTAPAWEQDTAMGLGGAGKRVQQQEGHMAQQGRKGQPWPPVLRVGGEQDPAGPKMSLRWASWAREAFAISAVCRSLQAQCPRGDLRSPQPPGSVQDQP
uniref:Uncharacterized protein n=1 Tax=Gopherus agassizii TaxID=38772 RepID=A0A452HTF5_9SAUR